MTDEEIKKAKLKKEAELKKEAKKKEKKLYDIKVETLVPATFHYRISALNEEEAYSLIKSMKPNSIIYNIRLKRDLKVIIYDAGSLIIRLIKNIIR